MLNPLRAVIVIAVASLFVGLSLAEVHADARSDAAQRGANFIVTTQTADGGFGAFGQSLDAVIALRAAGRAPASLAVGGVSALDFFNAHVAETGESAGLAGKAALAATALDLNPRTAGGTDLPALITSFLNPATGLYGADSFTQSIAIMGLACTANQVPPSAISALRQQSGADGGWGFGGVSDPDTTAVAVQALLAAGVPAGDPAVAAGIAYFAANQLSEGGWGFDVSNTSSTAFVIQAILAAGGDPAASTYTKPAGNPFDYLLSQQAQNGSFSGFDPAFATNQVVPALAGRTFCNAASTPLVTATPTPTATSTSAPTATATATNTAVPTAAATATRAATPAPPATGTGAGPSGQLDIRWLALLGSALIVAAAATRWASRRR